MRLRLLLLLAFLLMLTACASVTTTPIVTSRALPADSLFDAGNYREAAQAYSDYAATVGSPDRDIALLRAADSWDRAGNQGNARQALAQSNRRRLSGEDGLRHDMLNAKFLLADGRAREALALLNQNSASIPESQRARWHGLRAHVFEANGLLFDVAVETAQLMHGLSASERGGASRNIERLLGRVSNAELSSRSAALPNGDPLYPLAARELTKRGLPLPHPLDHGSMARTQNFLPADSDGYRPPTQLAVQLPISGTRAAPAASVRDGILAGYYNENRRRPAIKFYDTAGTADGVHKAATQAISDGAQMILGPLTRDEVGAIFSQDDVGVPVIALNRGPTAPTPGNASFALSPEEEGFVAADHLADRGSMKVFAISQHDDSAQRTLAAFREQLRARGGDIVAEASVADGRTDLSAPIQQAITSAKAPPDAVFLVLRGAQARLVVAQLKTSSVSALPRISSSMILSGNSRADGELDGIELPALPWLLDLRPELPHPDDLAKSLPSARGPAQALFAFGMDAWKLAVYFDRLSTDPAFSIGGATGELRLDSFGTVQREPTWAVLSGGRPRAIAPSH